MEFESAQDGDVSGFGFLGRLAEDPRLAASWMATAPRPLTMAFMNAMTGVCGLQAATDWPIPKVLAALVGDVDNVDDPDITVEHDLDITMEQLTECVELLDWITPIALEVPEDLTARRLLVATIGVLFNEVRDVQACDRALRRPLAEDDPTTPVELFAIGETEPAMRAALLPDEEDQAGPHLSEDGIDALLSYSNDEHGQSIGPMTAAVTLRHILRCARCSDAYHARATSLNLETAQLLEDSETLLNLPWPDGRKTDPDWAKQVGIPLRLRPEEE